jgi:hypothetical protein
MEDDPGMEGYQGGIGFDGGERSVPVRSPETTMFKRLT